MAKRKPRRTKKEKDFDKWIEKRAREFAEEIEEVGKRFEAEIDRKAKKHEKKCECKFEMFGPLGPLFGSAAGIIFVAIGIWVLNLVNSSLGSGFISILSDFMFSNLHWFFIISLFFNYNDYFRKFSKLYWAVSPLMASIGIVIVAWVLSWVFGVVSNHTDASVFPSLASFLSENLWGIFVIVLILGYAVVFVTKFFTRIWDV
jgi:hypothetical protein